MSHRILVVDDEARIRKSLSGLLQDNGYEVATVGSGSECLQIMSAQDFDLVILDIVMPEMSGTEVLEKIKEKYKDTEVIIITGYADKEKAIAAFRLNAYDFIEKPFESREILNTVANCLDRLKLRKEIEEKTRQLSMAEEKYYDLYNNAPDMYHSLDKDGYIIEVNQTEADALGYSKEELIGRHIKEIFTEDSGRKFRKSFPILLKKGNLFGLERQVIRKDGGVIDVSINVSVVYDEKGEPIKTRTIMRDITKKKEMENELASEKEHLLVTLRSIGDGVIVTDITGKVILINKVAEELTGWTQEEAIGRPYSKVFHIINEKTREEPENPIAKVIRTGLIVGLANHTMLLARNGTERIIADSGSPIKDKDGNIIGVVLVFRDVTEHRKAEEFIKNILESIDEGFIVVDREYRIISANRAFCDQVKMPVKDILGQHCYEISHHNSNPCYEAGEDCSVKYTFETGKPCSTIHTHYDKNGDPIFIELKSYPMIDTSGKVNSVIEIICDLTERKKLEAQLLHAQKMEAIGQLAGGIAHDFNNILTAIMGYGGLLLMDLGKNSISGAHITEIISAAQRAANLTQALLAFSRKQIISPKPVNLNDIVKVIKNLLLRLIGEDIELSIKVTDSPLIVMADATQIEQVLMNLATNARDAMPDGGNLIISTDLVELNDQFVETHGYGRPGTYALISVADTGHGMDIKTREKIFEPFFTTKEVGKGTGLGLAMVYGIVKQNEGYINVYSEPDKGAMFKIYLPLIQSMVGDAKPADSIIIRSGSEIILVAEDDIQVRGFIKKLLEKYGYKVMVAIDGEDAIRVFNENKDKIQLIILDTIMPKKNGKEVYDEIKKVKPDIEVIFTSGYVADIVQEKGILEKGLNFIPKPIFPQELLVKVYEALNNRNV